MSKRLKRHISEELLTDYANGLISHDTHQKIRQHISHCEQCASVLEGIIYLQENYVNKHCSIEDILNVMDPEQDIIPKKNIQNPNSSLAFYKRIPIQKTLKIASSLALLICMGYYAFIVFNTVSTESQIKEYLSEQYMSPIIKRNNSNIENQWKRIANYYTNKNYEQAIATLKRVIQNDHTNQKAHFYLGLCYLYQSNPNYIEAAKILSAANLDSHTFFKEQIRWFLALASYQSGDITTCKDILQQIANQGRGHFRFEEAQKLLNMLLSNQSQMQ